MVTLTLDFETTTRNKGHVFTPNNFVVSYSAKLNDAPPVFKHYTDIDFLDYLHYCVSVCTTFVGFNCKFDLHWLRRLGYQLDSTCAIWDCQLAEFILSGQTLPYSSLNDALESYGLPIKLDKVKEYWDLGLDTTDVPIEILKEYNNDDTEKTYSVYVLQQQFLSEKQRKLVLLEGEDMKTLMDAEWHGMKWDMEAADYQLRCYKDDLDVIRKKLWTFVPEEAKPYFNWESGDHLSLLLYGGTADFDYAVESQAVYKSGERKGQEYIKRSWKTLSVAFPPRFKPLERTLVKKCQKEGYAGTLFYQVDEPTLKQLKSRKKEDMLLLSLLFENAKVSKLIEMFEELFSLTHKFGWQDSLIHGQFNQNVVRTGRLSSSQPNAQNKPVDVDRYLVSRYDS